MYLHNYLQNSRQQQMLARAQPAAAAFLQQQQQQGSIFPSGPAVSRPAAAPQSEPEPAPVEQQQPARPPRGRPPTGIKRTNGGLIKTTAPGVIQRASELPRGANVKHSIPTIGPQVASILDNYRDIDHIQSEIASLRRAANLMARGFTKSSQTKVVIPPDYSGSAAAGGLPAPDVSREIVSAGGGLPASQAPAKVANDAQGEMVGKDGDPQAATRRKVAQATRFPPSDPKIGVNASAVGGKSATGYAADSVAEGVVPLEAGGKTAAINDLDGDSVPTAAVGEAQIATKSLSGMFRR